MSTTGANDLRFALRSLRRRPGFAAAVVATLALGVGASTAMFSLVDAALLRPLPFAEPDRLAILWGVFGPERDVRGASVPEVADWRAMNKSLTDVSLFSEISLNLRAGDEAERLDAEVVSAGYFPLLGVSPARGRAFLSEEDKEPDAHPVVVVSHRLWQTRFAGDPALVGRTITLNERPFTVVGIMPDGFAGLGLDSDAWIPSAMISAFESPELLTERGARWLAAVGRVRPGLALTDAQRDLDVVAARLAKAYPDVNKDRGVRLMTLRENYLGNTRPLLFTLSAAVLLFLLIACANVAGLQLVRATARRREIAVRLALGADRAILVRQLLTESLVLALLGGVAGVIAAAWIIESLVPLLPTGLLPTYVHVALDWRALAFSVLVACACGVVCGLVPALMSARPDLTDALKDGARAASSGLGRIRRLGPQQALVVGEVALALVLLVGAGLMMRSLAERLGVKPGFRPQGVTVARVTLPAQRYEPPARVAFADRVAERLGALPGVQSASVSSDLPFTGSVSASMLKTDHDEPEPIRYYRHVVSPAFFATLGIPLVRGRAFTAQDRKETPAVAIVSAAMAKRFWPNEDPIGRRLHVGPDGKTLATVVGVAGTARFRDLTTELAAPGSEPDVYFPLAQRPEGELEIAVRTRSGSPLDAATLRRELAAVDPGVPLFAVKPLAEAVRAQSATARFGSLVLASFSTVALALAAIGIYGVIAFVVGLSAREIAIRLALGAEPGAVSGLVVRNGMALVLGGVLLGVLGAALGTRVLASQLFGVSPSDPATFAVVTAVVFAVSLLASYVPARRAARVDPQLALKSE